MNLSSDLISQFVKATKDEKKVNNETTVYGTVRERDGKLYVQIDGSDVETPVTTTTVAHEPDRVAVLIKNHTATITGNLSVPAARFENPEEVGSKIHEFEIAIGDKATVEELAAERARIDALKSENVTITKTLTANEASIKELQAKDVEITGKLEADEAEINKIKTDKIDAAIANSTFATIENLEATDANVHNLNATYSSFASATAERLNALDATIEDLDVDGLDARFANIDFSNIDKAAMEYLYSKSGLIENVVIGDGTMTGVLVGVTIKGDLIEGGTVVADKLVIQGDDGLYYKLNTDGVRTEAEQTEYNSLDGSVITAKSITATKINVSDLVAFDATIGGFNVTTNALYSGVKESIDNTTHGIFMDSEGQMSLGDGDNYLRYFKDASGNWKLEISAESILFGKDLKNSAEDIKALTEHVKIGTYTDPETEETQPCVELAEGDSNFKQVITNTSTLFMDGSSPRTVIDTDGVSTENLTVTNDFNQGGFVWKVRSNGNLGLVWKGVTG